MKFGKTVNRAIRFLLLLAFCALPIVNSLHRYDLMPSVGLILAGMLWRVWASGHLDKGARVCDTGPYALSRHPLYLGTLLIALGYAKLWMSWPATAAFVGALGIIEIWRAMLEEVRLADRFGDFYEAYRRRVPAFFPTPWSLARAVRSRALVTDFDFIRVWKNGDTYRTLALFAGLVAVAFTYAPLALIVSALIVGYIVGRSLKDGLRGIRTLHLRWRTAYDLGREIWTRKESRAA
jgi:protein-S-isoprenylcysteine O-methyltransferase Ste14